MCHAVVTYIGTCQKDQSIPCQSLHTYTTAMHRYIYVVTEPRPNPPRMLKCQPCEHHRVQDREMHEILSIANQWQQYHHGKAWHCRKEVALLIFFAKGNRGERMHGCFDRCARDATEKDELMGASLIDPCAPSLDSAVDDRSYPTAPPHGFRGWQVFLQEHRHCSPKLV